jgi:hypothetical protein
MTRWGNVAYYLAAWLFGCLFIALLQWLVLPAIGGGFDFFFLYYSALVSCVLSCLLFGFLLQLTCGRATRFAILLWSVIGSVLHTLLVVLLGRIGAALGHAVPGTGLRHLLFLVSLKGPVDLSLTSLWIPLLAGAATAIVLCLFHRAFAAQQQSSL